MARVIEATPRPGGGWIFIKVALEVDGKEVVASGLIRVTEGNIFATPSR
jgi:hypothetical protein